LPPFYGHPSTHPCPALPPPLLPLQVLGRLASQKLVAKHTMPASEHYAAASLGDSHMAQKLRVALAAAASDPTR